MTIDSNHHHKETIYMDYAATTPVDPRVAEVMMQCLTKDGCFANPASSSHHLGRQARGKVEMARRDVAALINAKPEEIIWTSGATESDNLALKGVAYYHAGLDPHTGRPKSKRHLITSKTEHKAVLDTCKYLESQGFDITFLKPKPECNGLVCLDELKAAIREETVLVSIMHVNNELGVIQDIAEIANICQAHGIVFHVDAAQSAGKIPFDVSKIPVDLASFSGHKIYGPKGIGALYVRDEHRVQLEPLIHGGGHESGLRSGTLATHQIAGMGEAFKIAKEQMEQDEEHIAQLRDRFWSGIKDLNGLRINGFEFLKDDKGVLQQFPGVLNISFAGIEGESLLYSICELAVSSGSACTSAKGEPSYVLRALGRDDQSANSSIRFSFGRFTTSQEVDRAIEVVREQVSRIRAYAA